MKKTLILLTAICMVAISRGQNLAKVTITDMGNIEKLSFGLRENVLLNISKDGNIMDWGIDRYAGRLQESKPGVLDPYQGRVEYYTESDNEAFRGKVKSIGGVFITYYPSSAEDGFAGKVKTVGPNKFDYYKTVDNEAFRGNIKSAGQTTFTWYSSYDNAAYSGKPKSIGSSNITYYSNFDDQAFRGKLKSLGSQTFTYYSSTDLKDFRGRPKNGMQFQFINGIKYQFKY